MAVLAAVVLGCESSKPAGQPDPAEQLPSPPDPSVDGWLSFRGPPEEIRILFVSHPGWGSGITDTISLGGSGEGVWTRAEYKLGTGRIERPSVTSQRLVFNTRGFLALLTEFYTSRFFQMDDRYLGSSFPRLEDNGQIVIRLGGVADAGSSELIVQLGEYRKSVHFHSSPEYCPDYILALEKRVKAFAWDSRVIK